MYLINNQNVGILLMFVVSHGGVKMTECRGRSLSQ